MARITPCPRFDGKAEEAAAFYASIFALSPLGQVLRGGEGGPGPQGGAPLVSFALDIALWRRALEG